MFARFLSHLWVGLLRNTSPSERFDGCVERKRHLQWLCIRLKAFEPKTVGNVICWEMSQIQLLPLKHELTLGRLLNGKAKTSCFPQGLTAPYKFVNKLVLLLTSLNTSVMGFILIVFRPPF